MVMKIAEYIDREKLRQNMYREAFEKDSDLQRWDSGCWIRYKLFENVFEKTEVADVQPVKHGRWVRDAVYVDETTGEPCLAWFCNQCGEPQMVGTNFCPNCGAKMDGET